MMCLSDAHNKNATGECKWKTKTVTRASAAPIPLLLMLTNGAGLPAVYQRDAEAPASHPSAVFPRHCLHSGRGQTLPGSTITRNHEFLTHADDAQFVSRGPPCPLTRQTSSSHRLYSPQSFFFFSVCWFGWPSTYGTLHAAAARLSLAVTSKAAHSSCYIQRRRTVLAYPAEMWANGG